MSLLLRLIGFAARLAPAIFMVDVTRFQIVPEERELRLKPGDAYQHHGQQTRRWL